MRYFDHRCASGASLKGRLGDVDSLLHDNHTTSESKRSRALQGAAHNGKRAISNRKQAAQSLCGKPQYVYTLRIYIEVCDMSTAKVFRSGNSQAVRLPKQFRLKSKEVEIFRRGDEIVLREKKGTMLRAFELLAGLPDDLTIAAREKDTPQKRKGL
jgi:antitoxin VapB